MSGLLSRTTRATVSFLPPRVIRFLGWLQFRLPILGPLIGRIGRGVIAGEGTIRHGLGAGLKIDATGMNPGFVLGTADPLEQQTMKHYLKPGGVFFDIGANVGYFCLLARRLVGPEGKVVAFEPHPRYAEMIRKNARLNGFDIQVIEAAAADKPGETRLALDGVSCPSIRRGESANGIQVRVVSVDDLLAHGTISPPTYVLIDAEGAEMAVLEGMKETLRRHRPVVLTEVHWLGQAFLDFVEKEIRPLGYSLGTIDNQPIPSGNVRYHALLVPQGVS